MPKNFEHQSNQKKLRDANSKSMAQCNKKRTSDYKWKQSIRSCEEDEEEANKLLETQIVGFCAMVDAMADSEEVGLDQEARNGHSKKSSTNDSQYQRSLSKQVLYKSESSQQAYPATYQNDHKNNFAHTAFPPVVSSFPQNMRNNHQNQEMANYLYFQQASQNHCNSMPVIYADSWNIPFGNNNNNNSQIPCNSFPAAGYYSSIPRTMHYTNDPSLYQHNACQQTLGLRQYNDFGNFNGQENNRNYGNYVSGYQNDNYNQQNYDYNKHSSIEFSYSIGTPAPIEPISARLSISSSKYAHYQIFDYEHSICIPFSRMVYGWRNIQIENSPDPSMVRMITTIGVSKVYSKWSDAY